MTRLEIAARPLAAMYTDTRWSNGVTRDAVLSLSIELADALIARERETRPKVTCHPHRYAKDLSYSPTPGIGTRCVDCGAEVQP